MANKPLVACPKCKRKQPFRTPDSIYFCESCRMQFDTDDDGGDFFSDPSRRLELADEDRVRRQNRTRSRINGR